MLPDSTLEYYLVVLPRGADSSSWRLEEVNPSAGARSHRQVATGSFTPCNHLPYSKPGNRNRANFFTCKDAHMNDTLMKSGLMLQYPDDAPMWIYCAQGCCLAG